MGLIVEYEFVLRPMFLVCLRFERLDGVDLVGFAESLIEAEHGGCHAARRLQKPAPRQAEPLGVFIRHHLEPLFGLVFPGRLRGRYEFFVRADAVRNRRLNVRFVVFVTFSNPHMVLLLECALWPPETRAMVRLVQEQLMLSCSCLMNPPCRALPKM